MSKDFVWPILQLSSGIFDSSACFGLQKTRVSKSMLVCWELARPRAVDSGNTIAYSELLGRRHRETLDTI